MASGTPLAQIVRIQPLTLYYWAQKYPAAYKLRGGRIIIRRRTIFAVGRGWAEK